MAPRSARRAFSLIELVAVMVVMGIMALTSAGPVLIYMGTVRGGAAAARISADIRYMQRMSLSSGRRTWVVFNTGANNYQLFIENASLPGKANRQAVTHPMEQSAGVIQFGSGTFAGVTISSAAIGSGSEIEFDSFGVPYDTAGVALSAVATISLSTGNNIVLQPISGFAEVQ